MDQIKLENPQMHKGVVLESNENETVVLEDNGDVLKLYPKGILAVGQQVYFFNEDIYNEKNTLLVFSKMKSTIIGIGLVAAMFMFFVLYGSNTPQVAAIVSIDINPSIELSLDARNYVVSAEALNQDAVSLMQGINVKGKTSLQAIEMIILQAKASGYETERRSVLLAIAPLDSFDSELVEMVGELEKLSKSKNYVFIQSKEVLTVNAGERISIGRTLLKKQYSTLNQEFLSHATIKEIFELINSKGTKVKDADEDTDIDTDIEEEDSSVRGGEEEIENDSLNDTQDDTQDNTQDDTHDEEDDDE